MGCLHTKTRCAHDSVGSDCFVIERYFHVDYIVPARVFLERGGRYYGEGGVVIYRQSLPKRYWRSHRFLVVRSRELRGIVDDSEVLVDVGDICAVLDTKEELLKYLSLHCGSQQVYPLSPGINPSVGPRGEN